MNEMDGMVEYLLSIQNKIILITKYAKLVLLTLFISSSPHNMVLVMVLPLLKYFRLSIHIQ